MNARALLLAVTALALTAGPAYAGTATISLDGSTLLVDGDPTGNRVTISYAADRYIVTHNGPVTAEGGCQVYGPNLPLTPSKTLCPGPGVTRVVFTGRGGDDEARIEASVPAPITELDGGDGDDALVGGPRTDLLTGGGGTDELIGYGGHDRADYRDHWSPVTVSLDGVANDGVPGEGDNVHPTIEEVRGGLSPDHLIGGPGPDRLLGGPGGDTLDGLGGGDALTGGPGDDILNGGDGIDTFLADAVPDGRDEFNGGAGPFDEVSYAARATAVTVDIDGAADDGASGEGDDVRPDVERITGGLGNDWLVGSTVANLLTGGPGQDFLSGRAGDDTLLGQDGNDVTQGGDGNDAMTGGNGADTLYGAAGADSLQGIDGVAANDLLIGAEHRDSCQSDVRDTETDCEF
jgi:Ca2+-binding RTX toxin-like protein